MTPLQEFIIRMVYSRTHELPREIDLFPERHQGEGQRADMIVKIQRPLYSSDGSEMALVYDEDRSFQAQMPFSHCADLFGPDDLKVYVKAKLRAGVLQMSERVPDQPW